MIKKADIEALIGPLDSWFKYYIGIGVIAQTVDQSEEDITLFWSAVAALDEDGQIRDPKKTRVFIGVIETLSEKALVAAMGGVQTVADFHEEGGQFDTARTLRAVHDVVSAEFTKRHRKWDA